MNLPLISIITICFNSEKTIRKTIESVLNQTYSKIEYILVDGKSTDGTVEIIKEYEPQFKEKGILYRYISEPDNGIYDAMNKGIRLAAGEWLGIMNSDDWYDCDALNEEIASMLTDDTDLLYGYVKEYRNNIATHQGVAFNTALPHGTMCHQGIIYRKQLHIKFGYYLTSYKICSDYLFLASCYKGNAKFKFSNKLIAHFRHGGAHTNLGYYAGVEEAEIQLKFGFISRAEYYKKIIKAFARRFL